MRDSGFRVGGLGFKVLVGSPIGGIGSSSGVKQTMTMIHLSGIGVCFLLGVLQEWAHTVPVSTTGVVVVETASVGGGTYKPLYTYPS